MPGRRAGAIVRGMLRTKRSVTASTRPATADRRRVRLVGLRRALAALEAGERANDRLHHWTIAPRTPSLARLLS
jgi:hypothetical protein